MKKTSLILSLILSILLVLPLFAVFANAATAINYSVTSATGAQGDTVTVYVKVSSSTPVTGGQVSLNYDSSKLQYVSGTAGGMFTTESVRQSGSSVLCTGMTMGDSSAKKSGTFATVKFKILASSGSVALTLKPSSIAQDHVGAGDVTLSPAVSNGKVTVTKPVTGISLDKTSVTLKKGETANITATVTPSDATNKAVTYKSSNTKIATVNGGKITAVGGGTAKITATAGGKSAVCTVNIKVAQTGITISGDKNKTVKEGGTLKLLVVKVPADATDSFSVTWTSSDNAVATVSANGTVTGVKPGTADITATSNGWKAVYTVTVTEKPSETESSTDAAEPSESSTEEEPSVSVPESTTESTTADLSTTEPTTAGNNDNKTSLYDKIFDKNKTVTKGYHYIMLLVVALVTALVSVTVTALVTSNIVKNKNKEKDPINPIEK